MTAYRVFPTKDPEPTSDKPPAFGRRPPEREARRSERTMGVQVAELFALAVGAGLAGLMLFDAF